MAASTAYSRSRAGGSSQSGTSRNYPADTAKQRFIEENYNKETSIRLGWYFSRKGTNEDEQPGTNSRQMEVCRKRIEDACPRPTSSLLRLRDRFENPVDYRKRAFRIDGTPTSGEWTTKSASTRPPLAEPVPDMAPPDPMTKAKLYEGFSHDGKGRVDYLKTRSKTLIPEQRYQFPMTTSFEYGWRMADVMDEPSKPRHARDKLVRDTFYARNGVTTLPLPLVN